MAGPAYTNNSGFADFGDFSGSEDISPRSSAAKAARLAAGEARMSRYHLDLSFLDAVNGGKQSIGSS